MAFKRDRYYENIDIEAIQLLRLRKNLAMADVLLMSANAGAIIIWYTGLKGLIEQVAYRKETL